MAWTHESVYQALVDRGEKGIASGPNPYVAMYDQGALGAILYSPNAISFQRWPMHLSEGLADTNMNVFGKLRAAEAITLMGQATEHFGQDSRGLSRWQVSDWGQLAVALGLSKQETPSPEPRAQY